LRTAQNGAPIGL